MSNSQADKLFELYKTSKQASVEKRLEDIFGFTNAGDMAKHTLPYSLGGAGLGALLGVLREYASANPEATGLESDALRTILTGALLGGGVGTSLGYFTSNPRYKSSNTPTAPPTDEQVLGATFAIAKATRKDDWLSRAEDSEGVTSFLDAATSPKFYKAEQTYQNYLAAYAIAEDPQADPKDVARAREMLPEIAAEYRDINGDQARADGYMGQKGIQPLTWSRKIHAQVSSSIQSAIETAGQGQQAPGVRVEYAHSLIMNQDTPTTLVDIEGENGQPMTIRLPYTDVYANGGQPYSESNIYGYSPYVTKKLNLDQPLRPTHSMARLAAGLEYHQAHYPNKRWSTDSPEVVRWADDMNRQLYNHAITGNPATRSQFDQTMTANPNFMKWVSRIDAMANSSLVVRDEMHSYIHPSSTDVATLYEDAARDTRPSEGDYADRLHNMVRGGLIGGGAGAAVSGGAAVGADWLDNRTVSSVNQLAHRISSGLAPSFGWPHAEMSSTQLKAFAKDIGKLSRVPGFSHAKDSAKALLAETQLRTASSEMTQAAKDHWIRAGYNVDLLTQKSPDRVRFLRGVIGGAVDPDTGKTIVQGIGKSLLESANEFTPRNLGPGILRRIGGKYLLPTSAAAGAAYGGYGGWNDINPAQLKEQDILIDRLGKYFDTNTSSNTDIYGDVPGTINFKPFEQFRGK